MTTLGEKLAANKGIGQGFDFLRIALAVMVLLNHSFLIVDGSYDRLARNNLWCVFNAILPMFFALSGFLITGSAQRLKLKDFLINRSIRIVPALAVDIFVSSLLIGVIFTTMPLHEYFQDKKFLHYFLNVIGFIHYELPGVFESNPFPGQVNGSLWTVPFEIGCYALMSCLILLNAVNYKLKIIITSGAFIAASYALGYWFSVHANPLATPTPLHNYANNFVSERGNYLYFYFLGGALLYVIREHVPCSKILAGLSATLIIFFGLWPIGDFTKLILMLPIAYVTVYVGVLPIPKIPFYSRGDYSYGVYLYGYPLQQVLILLLPGLSIAVHFALSLICASTVALFSWHCIEKPILKIRKKFSFTARKGN